MSGFSYFIAKDKFNEYKNTFIRAFLDILLINISFYNKKCVFKMGFSYLFTEIFIKNFL